MRVAVRERYNTGIEKTRTDPTLFDWAMSALDGSHRTTINNGEMDITLAADSITENVTRLLIAKDASLNNLCEANITFINTGCNRPAGLEIFTLSYHHVSTSGVVTGYTTLDQAILLAGKKFDGTLPGDLQPFAIQANGLAVGTTVYLGTGTDCGVVSDEIYYVLGPNGGNSIRLAIQVANGVIVAVKQATYTTNTPPIPGSIADKTYTVGVGGSFQHPTDLFVDPGDTVTIAPSGFPAGVVYNAGTRTTSTGTTVPIGTYPVELIGTDSAGQPASVKFTIRVIAAPVNNNPPTAGTIATQTMTSSAVQTFTHADGLFSDPGDTFTVTATTPTGISYNASTRTVTKAAGVANGTYTITLTATDSIGQTATITFNIVVAVPAPPTVPPVGRIVIYRRTAQQIDFFYDSARQDITKLFAAWSIASVGRPANSYMETTYTAGGVTAPPEAVGCRFTDGLNIVSNIALLNSPSTYKVRLEGATDPLITFTFTASGIAIGEARTIYIAP